VLSTIDQLGVDNPAITDYVQSAIVHGPRGPGRTEKARALEKSSQHISALQARKEVLQRELTNIKGGP